MDIIITINTDNASFDNPNDIIDLLNYTVERLRMLLSFPPIEVDLPIADTYTDDTIGRLTVKP